MVATRMPCAVAGRLLVTRWRTLTVLVVEAVVASLLLPLLI